RLTASSASSGDFPATSSNNSRIGVRLLLGPCEYRIPQGELFFRRVLDRIEPVSLEAEQVPRLQHMRRQGRGRVDETAARMRDHNPARQQMQPFLQAARQLPVFLVEIFGVADDG